MSNKEDKNLRVFNMLCIIGAVILLIMFVWFIIEMNNIYSDMPSTPVCVNCEFRSRKYDSVYCDECYEKLTQKAWERNWGDD